MSWRDVPLVRHNPETQEIERLYPTEDTISFVEIYFGISKFDASTALFFPKDAVKRLSCCVAKAKATGEVQAIDMEPNLVTNRIMMYHVFPDASMQLYEVHCRDNPPYHKITMAGLPKYCFNCGGPTVKGCGGCGVTFYCDTRCQNEDWRNHRNFCRKIVDNFESLKKKE